MGKRANTGTGITEEPNDTTQATPGEATLVRVRLRELQDGRFAAPATKLGRVRLPAHGPAAPEFELEAEVARQLLRYLPESYELAAERAKGGE